MENNAMSIYIFLNKLKKLNLEILPNGKKYTFFCVLLKKHFNYSKN
jgi:hypothetical protein